MDTYTQSQHVKPSIFDLINLIYQAALQPELWQRILTDIRIRCGADQCTLFFYDALEPQRCLANAARADEKLLSHYLKSFIKQQAMQINSQLRSLPEGLVVTDYDIRHYAGEEYSGIVGENYMETFWPNLSFEAGVVLLRGQVSCAGLGLQNFTDSPPLQLKNIALLQELSPHLRQAMRLHQKFTQLEQTNYALTTVLHAAKVGVILLNEKFTIQFINNKAKQSLKKVENHNYDAMQHLVLDKISREHIHKIITQFDLLPTGCSINNSNNSDVKLNYRDGHLKVSGYAVQKNQTTADLNNPPVVTAPDACYLLLIQDSNPECRLNEHYLQSAYGITNAEHHLISQLINGVSLLNSAESQMVKPSTIRWHLKNIMQKTHTHSQPELARLMIELRDS